MRSMRATNDRIAERLWAWLRPMGLVLTIAGCAGSMGTIHTAPAPVPVTAFDGSYRSAIHVTYVSEAAKTGSLCDTPGQPIIAIANGQFSYALQHPNAPGNPTPMFQATMAADGSFVGQGNNGTISGQVHGTHLDGSIDGYECIYAFSGDRM